MPEVVLRDKSGRAIVTVSDDGQTLSLLDRSFAGLPIAVGYNRLTGQIAAVPNILTVAVGPVDAVFEALVYLFATVATTYSFDVTLAFTDQGGTVRTIKLQFESVANTISNSVALANGNGPLYMGIPFMFRAKAGTNMVIAVAGTFTTVTFDVEALIRRLI